MIRSDSNIYLPVSLGEAIDKLTILDIKLQKIKDSRKLDVQKEYDLLYSKLEQFGPSPELRRSVGRSENVTKYSDLYQTMKKVNMLIWDMMDLLRDGSLPEDEYLRVCKECIEFNDIRFRVKNKINYVSNSELREQKSYRINRIVIDIADEIEEVDDFILPIKYFSYIYDEIVIVSSNNKLRPEFAYDPTILFTYSIEDDKIEYKKRFSFKYEIYNQSKIYEIFGLEYSNIQIII